MVQWIIRHPLGLEMTMESRQGKGYWVMLTLEQFQATETVGKGTEDEE